MQTPAPLNSQGTDAGGIDILCIGSVLWDIVGRTPLAMRAGQDVPGRITRIPGGVALNIAAALARFGLRPAVLTAIGLDPEGDDLMAAVGALGIDTRFVHRSQMPTDRYMAIDGSNGLVAAIADAHSLEAAGRDILEPLADGRLGTDMTPWEGTIAIDGNLTDALLEHVAEASVFRGAHLCVAPASPGKALRLRPLLGRPQVTFYVNLEEASLIAGDQFSTASDAAAGMLAAGAYRALVTDGPRLAADGSPEGTLSEIPPQVVQARVTGAGDTFMAAHIVASRLGVSRTKALKVAVDAAATFVSGIDQVPSVSS